MIKLKDKLIYETLKLVESQGEDGLLYRNKQSDAEFMRPVNEFAAASGRNYTSIKSTLDIIHKNWGYLQGVEDFHLPPMRGGAKLYRKIRKSPRPKRRQIAQN